MRHVKMYHPWAHVSHIVTKEIPGPDDDSLSHDTLQILKPFDITLWILLAVFVTAVGMLNVCFASRRGERSSWRAAMSGKYHKNQTLARRCVICSQLCLASVLDSFVQYFGGGVEMEP